MNTKNKKIFESKRFVIFITTIVVNVAVAIIPFEFTVPPEQIIETVSAVAFAFIIGLTGEQTVETFSEKQLEKKKVEKGAEIKEKMN